MSGMFRNVMKVADPGGAFLMGKLFDHKSTTQPTPPGPPTINDAEAQAQDDSDALRKRRGMAATVLAGANPAGTNQPATQAARLLGS
jgi:hypothetical protein